MLQPESAVPNKNTDAAATVMPWHSEVGDLLAQAALLCIEHDLDVDTFLKGAWSAYVEARPGLKDYIEDMKLRNQLAEIRKNGRMGQA